MAATGLTRKGGKKNRKFGRNRFNKNGAPSDQHQKARTAANKARRIAKDKKFKEEKAAEHEQG